eukprot:gnl/Chilomastix_caulleri/3677.p4 GENE.gnl/Chilomastix_caulleri/3677~~gnl/Chilomastix_caulleri/3677.p4  ORF type:complete len:52 (+),score=4.21 gnl/Chilomastix_caulleri/3677:418-573(+)
MSLGSTQHHQQHVHHSQPHSNSSPVNPLPDYTRMYFSYMMQIQRNGACQEL